MQARSDTIGLLTRILAIMSLLIGLSDATAVLGLGSGGASPYQTLGGAGFILLVCLTVTRLFAAVGLWIRMQWGAVVLLASLIVEFALHFTGNGWIALSLWGFIFKTATLLATIALLGLSQILLRRQVAD